MSYNNDGMLVIANKFGKASSDAKAEMFEAYDRLRDLTVSGPSLGGTGSYGMLGSFLINFSRLISPTSFMSMLGTSAINVPGTSYYSPITGANSTAGAQSAFGMGQITNYPGFPGGAASLYSTGVEGLPLLFGIGNTFNSLNSDFTVGGFPDEGFMTGGAASITSGNSYTPTVNVLSGVSSQAGKYTDFVLPVAGVVAGVGGLVGALAPYFGPFGVLAGMSANLASGYAGAAIQAYQRVQAQILNNADTILSMKIKNIETVVKQLDVQGDIVRKMLKTSLEGDSKAIQEM